MIKPIPYGRQHISEEDIKAVVEVLHSDYLTQGPAVPAFEKAFADYIGCRYAVAVSNGTAALHLCTMALGVNTGDKVITTPITFAASANCIRYCGGEVVFSDIDPETYLLDITKVRKLLQSSPKGTFKGIFLLILPEIPAIWKNTVNWLTNTTYGSSKMPVMRPEGISPTAADKNRTAETVTLPNSPFFPSIP